jgi:hypothetical protein
MNGSAARFLRLGGGLSGLMVLGWVLTVHAAKPAPEGLPTDWTHKHLIFSQPSSFEQIGEVTSEPRYWQQWYRQNVRPVLVDPAASGDAASMNLGAESESSGAWSEFLGSGASVGAGNYPAKYSFQITGANCGSATQPDYVVFNTGLAGSTTQASVVAFDNLYSGCSGISPQVYWAYNTGGQVLTSPAISPGGSQVAFVQTNGGFGILVLLKWASASGTVGSPVTLTPVANSAYRNCTAPCMTQIFLQDGLGAQVDDTTSSVFPDYTHDIIWVGGALGWLHQITGVFRGTPAEVITGGYPVQLSATTTFLSSPVYDSVSGNVFVGDASGFFYRVTTASPPVVTKSGQVDHGTGLVAGPIVDSTAEKVYVFSSSDGSGSCTGGVPCSAVFEFAVTFGSGTTGAEAVVGNSQAAPPNPNPLYEGGFDSTYEASANATGNLYVCGNTGGAPTLYQIPISGGVMGTVLPGPVLTSATTGCSPVTDVPNPNATGGTSEFVFASAQTSGSGNNCAAGGCLMNFNVQPWQPAHAYTVGQEILDSDLQIQVCRTAGTSRTAAQGHPNPWNTTIDGSTTDAGVRWTDQGPHQASHPAWQSAHTYATGALILDSNGNVQWARTGGTSRTAAQGPPAWSKVVNGTTADGTVSWREVGAIATASVAASGGTSGIIMDNTVGTGTLAGASQIYFSTQGNQTCTTSGGSGGCAVQASQSALQ